MEKQFKPCPFCGSEPAFRVVVEDAVWCGKCSNPHGLNHNFYVMSWTGMEHCR